MLVTDKVLDTTPIRVSDILGLNRNTEWVWIQAKADNVEDILWGTAAQQTMELIPGAAAILPFEDISGVYIRARNGTAGVNLAIRSR